MLLSIAFPVPAFHRGKLANASFRSTCDSLILACIHLGLTNDRSRADRRFLRHSTFTQIDAPLSSSSSEVFLSLFSPLHLNLHRERGRGQVFGHVFQVCLYNTLLCYWVGCAFTFELLSYPFYIASYSYYSV